MRILALSPLYPPDIAEPAPYVKELARRLSSTHQVTILTYGRLPEKVPGVEIATVDKRRPLPLRLVAYTRALWRALGKADVIYAQNGASVELPLLLVLLFRRKPLLLRWGDIAAHERAKGSFFLHLFERIITRHARTLSDSPLQKSEMLPFVPRPTETLERYEKSWEKHLELLEKELAAARHA